MAAEHPDTCVCAHVSMSAIKLYFPFSYLRDLPVEFCFLEKLTQFVFQVCPCPHTYPKFRYQASVLISSK